MENRKKILDISLELFSNNGFSNTGIQEIVDKANISKPTMYYYFGSKDGVLDEILLNYMTPFIQDLRRELVFNGDIKTSLLLLSNLFFSMAEKNSPFYKLFITLAYSAPNSVAYKKVKPYFESIYLIIEKLFVDATSFYPYLKNKHKDYAFHFLAILNSYCSIIINKEIELTDRININVVDSFLYGINRKQ